MLYILHRKDHKILASEQAKYNGLINSMQIWTMTNTNRQELVRAIWTDCNVCQNLQ